MQSHAASAFTSYQKFVVGVLAFLQFTIVLDFMILSPLGAILMPALKITPQQFGSVVSAYAFSAGASGLIAGSFADRFDRKRLLLFFYGGFLLGTLFCALAPSYEYLLAARMVTGIFGGVIGSIVFAITTDLFPMAMRGRVMGIVQTAFGASQVLGIPIGLYLSARWGWHMPFLMIVAVGAVAGVVIFLKLKPVDEHLKLQRKTRPFEHLTRTVTNPRYVQGFLTTALLATGGFMLMPFGSAFNVNNLGVAIDDLPLVYMITGVGAMVSGPFVGKLSDSVGKFKMFVAGSLLTIVMCVIYCNLGVTPLGVVIGVSVLMFVGVSARMISSQALISGVPSPADRGSYMSVSASIQQVSGGLASLLAGAIVREGEGGRLENFPLLGYVVVAATVVTMISMYRIKGLVADPSPLSTNGKAA